MALQYVLLYFYVHTINGTRTTKTKKDPMMQDGTESESHHKRLAHRRCGKTLRKSFGQCLLFKTSEVFECSNYNPFMSVLIIAIITK